MSSAKEIDLNPNTYIGLTYPIKSGINTDFEMTQNSYDQAQYNLENLLLTQKGERPFQPEFGSNLRKICFEQIDANLPETIEEEIRTTVEDWLPYITLNDIQTLTNDGDVNRIYVKIKYSTTLDSFKENTITVAFNAIT
jgi:phage baseplate assembly protein W